MNIQIVFLSIEYKEILLWILDEYICIYFSSSLIDIRKCE